MCSSVSAGSLSRTSIGGSGAAFLRSIGAWRSTPTRSRQPLTALQHWAEDRGLKPSEADYQDLQFTADGDSDAERAYRTHWASTDTP